MAWGWETVNICQSKLSWVLLGFGEWTLVSLSLTLEIALIELSKMFRTK